MCVSGNKPQKNELNYDPLNEIIEIFNMLLNYNLKKKQSNFPETHYGCNLGLL